MILWSSGHHPELHSPLPPRLRLRVMLGNAGLPQIVTVMRGHDGQVR